MLKIHIHDTHFSDNENIKGKVMLYDENNKRFSEMYNEPLLLVVGGCFFNYYIETGKIDLEGYYVPNKDREEQFLNYFNENLKKIEYEINKKSSDFMRKNRLRLLTNFYRKD